MITTAPRNGMNIGALALMPSRRSCDHVAHLVHEQQHHEADRERPAEEQPVGGDRDERRAGGRQQLEFRQQQQDAFDRREELGDQRGDRRERAADALAQVLRRRALTRGGSPNGFSPRRSAAAAELRRAAQEPADARKRRRCPCAHCGSSDKRLPNDARAARGGPVRPPATRLATGGDARLCGFGSDFFLESAGWTSRGACVAHAVELL